MPEGFVLPRERLEVISQDIIAQTASNLGIEPHEVTDDLRQIVDTSIQASINRRVSEQVSLIVDKNVVAAVAGNLQPVPEDRIGAQLKFGSQYASVIAQNQEYLDLLKQNAKMMHSKFTAYKDAGFSDEQAFSLVEAEVYAKGGTKVG
jgi:hypothetical protein